jgi:fructose-specific component phosphotransferase system IIB-like protein
MPNIPVTRAELAEKVLAAIRQEQGCEGVKEINITAIDIVDGESTWRASVIDGGSASVSDAYHAADRITEIYTRLFRLEE